MTKYKFGANILENLTTGMYQDSKVVYREYIQNACDQIDKAVKSSLIQKNEGRIEIWLDYEKRSIVIEDNATGISELEFIRVLGNIADSDKKLGEDKGFRGIGRLCGLAYCEKLTFTTSHSGEPVRSIMTCDARKMRHFINESTHGQKHSAEDVLDAINMFHTEAEDASAHYFRVELLNINPENTSLLNTEEIRDYLSFVAPVPYQNTFYYRDKVYAHAKELDVIIDEYNITLNAQPIFKKYITDIKDADGKKNDDIFDVQFYDILDDRNIILGWMWIGLSQFKKAIPAKMNPMRGIRLRKENIQIGTEDTLQKLFKEERGNNYFVGEVFAVSQELIPNSRRDYFNENQTRVKFEKHLRDVFNELHILYRLGSEANSAIKAVEDANKKASDFTEMEKKGHFSSKEEKTSVLEEVEKVQKEAKAKVQKVIYKSVADDSAAAKVLARITQAQKGAVKIKSFPTQPDGKADPLAWLHQKLPQKDRALLKLLNKIFTIIRQNTDKDIYDILVEKIINELK
jgi:molecular chaperone HtpG